MIFIRLKIGQECGPLNNDYCSRRFKLYLSPTQDDQTNNNIIFMYYFYRELHEKSELNCFIFRNTRRKRILFLQRRNILPILLYP